MYCYSSILQGNSRKLFTVCCNRVVVLTKHYSTLIQSFSRNKVLKQSNSYSSFNFLKMCSQEAQHKKQIYDYLLVLDFEATCDKPVNPVPQEIIEFPVLKVNGKTFETESVFHYYVQPKVHKELSTFCIELTGIIQDMVDEQPYLEDVLQKFDSWMKDEKILHPGVRFAFVTCGDWDLKTMLPGQCQHFTLPLPTYMKSWINIKKCFADDTTVWPKSLLSMMEYLKLPHEGRLHSGIDDCKNIASILKALAERGYIFQINGKLW